MVPMEYVLLYTVNYKSYICLNLHDRDIWVGVLCDFAVFVVHF